MSTTSDTTRVGWRALAALASLQLACAVVVFGLVDSVFRAFWISSNAALGLAVLAVGVAVSCALPALFYAHMIRRRDPDALPTERCTKLALRAVLVHVVVMYLWVFFTLAMWLGVDLLLIATMYIVPFALMAFVATYLGLRPRRR